MSCGAVGGRARRIHVCKEQAIVDAPCRAHSRGAHASSRHDRTGTAHGAAHTADGVKRWQPVPPRRPLVLRQPFTRPAAVRPLFTHHILSSAPRGGRRSQVHIRRQPQPAGPKPALHPRAGTAARHPFPPLATHSEAGAESLAPPYQRHAASTLHPSLTPQLPSRHQPRIHGRRDATHATTHLHSCYRVMGLVPLACCCCCCRERGASSLARLRGGRCRRPRSRLAD